MAEQTSEASLLAEIARLRAQVAELEQGASASEQATRQREAQLLGVIDSAMDAIISVDAEQRIVCFNRTAEQFFGYRADEVIGKPLDLLIPERHRDAHHRHIIAFGCTGVTSRSMGDLRVLLALRRDGREFPIEASICQVIVDGNRFFTVILRDVTARVEAERHLHVRDRALAAARTGITITDARLPDQPIIYCNPAFEQITGYTTSEVLGRNCRFLQGGQTQPAARRQMRAAIESAQPARTTILNYRKDGTPFWNDLTIAPIYDEGGVLTHFVGVQTDITERKEAEAALRASEERFALAFRASPIAMSMSTLAEGRFVDVNPQFLQMLGYSREELIGHTVYELGIWVNLVDRAHSLQALHHHRGTYTIDAQFITKDGQVRDALASIERIDLNGEQCLLTLTQDVTERKRSEAALRASEARFMSFMDHTPLATWITTGDGIVVYCNMVFRQTLQLLEADPIGKSLFDLWPADLAQEYIENNTLVLHSDEPIETIERSLRSNGTMGEYLVYRFPLHDGYSEPLVGGLALDITDRRRAEQLLAEREERFRVLVQHSSDLIMVLDCHGTIADMTPAVTATLGYEREALLGVGPLALTHPDDQALVGEKLAYLIETPGATERATVRGHHANGSWVWLDVVAVNLLNEPAVHGIVVTARDITERRRLEAQFFQAQKIETVGRLAGGVAHDFNNLLTAIMSYTELAMDGLSTEHQAHYDLEEVLKATRRAANLTQQLLAFARKQVINPQIIDLNDHLLDIASLLRRLIGADIELVLLPAPQLWLVRADASQIEQVVINLAVNARDAMPEGGRLTITTHNVDLEHVHTTPHTDVPPGVYVQITISDTGVGMDEELLARAFEPFFTTKEQGQGTGLGLATCYGIVAQHNGYITCVSAPNEGATFTIYLPRVLQGVATRDAPAPEEPLPLRSETVLLVEDEAAVMALAARVLRGRGYTVLEATNGEEALRVAEQSGWTIDLLISDVVMPRMGGRELVPLLLRHHPTMRVLFISGYTNNAITNLGQLSPGIAFLQKPFAPKTLLYKVEEVLNA